MEVIYSINGKYFKAFGVYISESKGLLDKLKPKPRKSYDWAEYHGKVVDLSAPKYEEREITLTGWIEGKNWHEMKQNFDALLSEFDKGGLVRLLVEFGKELVYDVFLADGVELEKSFKESEIIGKFSLKLKELNPVKKVLKLVGNNLLLSFDSEDWVEVNIDGNAHSYREQVSINKGLQNRNLISVSQQGRNLMLNSKSFSLWGNDMMNSDNSQVGRIVVGSSNAGWNAYTWINLSENHKVGDEIVFSIDIKSSIDCNITINYLPYYALQHYAKTNSFLSGQWKRVYLTGKIQRMNNNRHLINIQGGNMAGAVVEFKNAKIEKGNKPTDWTPAPEETHYITIAGNIDKIKNLQTNAEEIW